MPDTTTTPTPTTLLPPIPDPFYPDPPWATPTSDEWTLIEIKGGIELSKLQLSQRPCWLIGRAADQVDIPMQHPSISRCHARLAFDKTGTLWLRDCNSTHGIFVNKKRVPEEARGTQESNSTQKGARGVVLYPGDVLQLGASTRLYCVEGPEQFQRGRIRLVKPPNQSTTKTAVPSKPTSTEPPQQEESITEEDDSGVSWGISMNDELTSQAEEEESVELAMKRQQALESNIPEKHRKAWEKIQALKYKLQNIQAESERIQRKGESNLTTGQENQLKRNAEREQQLGEQILEREKELYEKINPNAVKKEKKLQHDIVDEEDDDEFFDRTKSQNNHEDNNTGEGETEESLLAKWKNLKAQQERNQTIKDRAQQKVENLTLKLERLQAAGDEEAFFAQNDVQLAKEQLDKVENAIQKNEKEMEETKRLLKIVNPNLVLVEQKKVVVDDGDIMPPPMLPPPVRKPTQPTADAKEPEEEDSFSKMMPPPMMPPPNRKRSLGPAQPPPQPTERSPPLHTETESSSPPSKKKVKGPARGPPTATVGTLAALTAVSSLPSSPGGQDGSHSGNHNKKEMAPAKTIDLQKDEWRAPKDQDGSGITKLNAKFAGRY